MPNPSAWGPVAIWAAVLFFLSALPLSGDVSWVPVNDKVIHVGLYGVLGVTLSRARILSGAGWPHGLFILVGVLYGVTDEFHQAFVPGRSVSVFDWIADVVGVLMGYTIFLKTISIREARARWAADADSKNRGI